MGFRMAKLIGDTVSLENKPLFNALLRCFFLFVSFLAAIYVIFFATFG